MNEPIKTTLRIDPDLYNKIKQVATADKRSINNALIMLLDLGMETYFAKQDKLLKVKK